jgi:acetoin utilization deacetylase AcuC-like enzyme
LSTAFTWNPGHAAHAHDDHPERPARLETTLRQLENDPCWSTLRHLPSTPATLDEALLVHTAGYLRRLEATVQHGGAWLDEDTYATLGSLSAALEGLGGLLAVTRAVVEGTARNGFALTRPPGHHARPDSAMGFCLLATVAIAARWARRQFGVERIALIDFDVHHGNGTQEVFYEDPNVLFVSLHQHPLYPGTGLVEEIGAGKGEGATVNLPLPAHTGDTGYLAAFRRVVEPVVRRFRPELLIVSAGYDAHWKDPLARMNLSTTGFFHLVRELRAWADAWADNRLVAQLEGGYHPDALAYSVRATLHALADDPAVPDDPIGPAPRPDTAIEPLLDEIAAFHRV